MVAGLASSGADVLLLTQTANSDHQEIRALSKEVPTGSLSVIGMPDIRREDGAGLGSLLSREWAYWSTFRNWFRIAGRPFRPTLVFVPYLDTCLYAMGLLGSPFGTSDWAGVAMRPSFHYPKMGIIAPQRKLDSIKRLLFMRLLRQKRLAKLMTIDEPLFEFVRTQTNSGERIGFLPQPAGLGPLPAREAARRMLGLSPERQSVLVYGELTARKGVANLLDALMDPGFPVSVDVVLAGRVGPEVLACLAQPRVQQVMAEGRIQLFDRYLSEAEERLVFAAADIVWLGYSGHYTASGVLTQAAAAGRPVIASPEGIIAWETRRHDLGVIISHPSVPQIVGAVKELMHWQASSRSDDTAQFRAPTSVMAAQSILVDSLLQPQV